MNLSFNLKPVEGQCANCGQSDLWTIAGRDEPSQAQISGWNLWCRKCQSLTMTVESAQKALAAKSSDAVGIVVAVRFQIGDLTLNTVESHHA